MVTENDIQIIRLNQDVLDSYTTSGVNSFTSGFYTTVNFILFTNIKCEVIVKGEIEDYKTAKEEVLKILNQ